ncbi:MAG: insulinase family protein [Deltaproteobacteria bacterium]|jgi:zinc protease|nr:insulinase family protein [Deltaproteobacteria bacterium]
MFSFRSLLTLFLCLASPLAGLAQTAAKDGSMPHIRSSAVPAGLSLTYLTNGLAVAVKKDSRFPLVSLRLYVHAGSAYETPEQAGISHQLEHMVFKGTESRPKGAVATDIEKAGGYLNAATSFDYTVYLTDMPAEHWALGLDVLKDMAFHPSLDPEELTAEKDVVLAELRRGEDSPSGRLFKRIQAAALKGTPYERPIIGYPETIKNFSAEGIRAYIKRLYHPQSMLLLVVGDVEPGAALAEAEKAFGGLTNTAPAVPPQPLLPEDFPGTGPAIAVETSPWNKVHLAVAFPGVAMNDARAPALDILAHALGGDTSSYFHQKYKYRLRLVDAISVSSYTFERAGLFTVTASLSPENLAPFWEAFTKDLAALGQRTYSEREIARAKLALADDLHREKETVAGIASSLGHFLFFGNGEDAEHYYLQQLDLVDREAVTKAAKAVLRPERLSANALVPEAAAKGGGKANPRSNTAGTADAAWMDRTLRAAWPVPAPDAAQNAKAAEGEANSREVIDLGQGRTLILQPDASMPYAAADLYFAGGDSLLSPDKQGLAAMTASALTKGTKTRNATQLEAFKNDRAASLSASSSREFFKISMDYPARFAPDMWRLLRETVNGATFPEEEIARAKENQTAAIVSREDQPVGLAFRKLFPFIFGRHLYGYQSLGDKERLAAFRRAEAVSFWNEQARRPWVLSVCGDFDRDAVIAAARKLPAPGAKAPAVTPPVWGDARDLNIVMPDRNQAHLLLVFPGAEAGSADEPGLELLQTILSGQSGLLFRDLRDKQGLGYTVTAFGWQAPLAGTLIFYIGTEPDKMDVAEAGFKAIIKDLRETLLPEEELARGKNQMRGDYVRSRQKMSARSAEAASLAILGRPLDAGKDLVDAAQKLNAAQLRDLAVSYLVTDKAYVVKVLPR